MTDFHHLPPDINSLALILKRLRAPDGCPWDREQTRETLARCFTEECAEYLDALDHHDPEAMCDELGDVMMNVVFQAVIAEEKGEFTLADVFANVNAKMVRRHAHIFGDATAESATDVVAIWEKIKAGEANRKPRESVLDGVPHELSSLNRAEKIQKKAAKVGFDWSREEEIIAKIEEELAELKFARENESSERFDEELGDLPRPALRERKIHHPVSVCRETVENGRNSAGKRRHRPYGSALAGGQTTLRLPLEGRVTALTPPWPATARCSWR